MNDTLTMLGKRIADLRNKRGLTQEKLAEMENDLKASDSRMEKLYSDLMNAYDWENI